MLRHATLAALLLAPAAALPDRREPEPTPPPALRRAASTALARLPISFEPLGDAADPRGAFRARGLGYALWATHDGLDLRLGRGAAAGALRIAVGDGRAATRVEPLRPLPGRVHSLVGSDPALWRRDVPLFGAVALRGVAPGVDLLAYGNGSALEYDLVVAPGTDPELLDLCMEGAQSLRIEDDGALVVELGAGTLRQAPPVSYQEIGGARIAVESRYALRGQDRVAFEVGAYDRAHPLVIDPVLEWATFFGGTADEILHDVAVDAAGAVYVCGAVNHFFGATFPTTPGAFQSTIADGDHAFVAKLSPNGDQLVYSTFLGGTVPAAGSSQFDQARSIDVDAAGNAYVTGLTNSSDFPTTAGAFQRTNTLNAAFVAKLAPAGDDLVYSTFLGSAVGDGIAVHADGTAYVAGVVSAGGIPTFPTTSSGFDTSTFASGSLGSKAFFARVAADGGSLLYSTLYGGSTAITAATDVAVDGTGGGLVAGNTSAGDLPTKNGFQLSAPGSLDHFVARFDSDASGNASLTYASYLGGSNQEGAFETVGSSNTRARIAVDASGAAYVAGTTASNDFPTTAGAFQTAHGGATDGSTDAFVVKIDPAAAGAASLVYGTFLGGPQAQFVLDVAVDGSGQAAVLGGTRGAMPLVAPIDATLGGEMDAFVSVFDSAGASLVFSTFFGGESLEPSITNAGALDVDPEGDLYFGFSASSSGMPVTACALNPTGSDGSFDGYVAKIALGGATADGGKPSECANANLGVTIVASADPAPAGEPLTYTIVVANAGPQDAAGVQLQASLPAAAALVSIEVAPAGTAVLTSAGFASDLPSIAPGGSFTFSVVVVPDATAGLVASVAVASAISDPDASDDSASLALDVLVPAALEVALGAASPTGSLSAGKGSLDVPLAQLRVSVPPVPGGAGSGDGGPQVLGERARVESIVLAASGPGNEATGLAAIRLYRDVNEDGAVGLGDALLGSGAFSADDGTLTITLASALLLAPGESELLVVACDVAGTAAPATSVPDGDAPAADVVAGGAVILLAGALRRRRSVRKGARRGIARAGLLLLFALVAFAPGCSRRRCKVSSAAPGASSGSFVVSVSEVRGTAETTAKPLQATGVPLEGATLQVPN